MARCWGITKKLHFCDNNAGNKRLCLVHEAQPKYFLAVAFTGILFSYLAGLIPVPSRGRTVGSLAPTDFQMQLVVSAHMNALSLDYAPPERVRVYSTVGPVLLTSEMALQPEVAREYPSIKNPTRSWQYVDKTPFVDRLTVVKAVDDLIGQSLSARLPVRAFKFKEGGLVIYQLYVYVRGREIMGQADDKGHIEIRLTKEMLASG